MDHNNFKTLFEHFWHPGIARMNHCPSIYLPYSITDNRQATSNCRVCAEIKPQHARVKGQRIKATSQLERLNIDFKGPLPSNPRNKQRFCLQTIDLCLFSGQILRWQRKYNFK